MPSIDDAIIKSLSTNLFFLRLMREHMVFLKASIPPKNTSLGETCGYYQRQFDQLLREAVQLSNGTLPADVVNSGQFTTPYTREAERVTQFYTGILIDSSITQMEENLQPGAAPDNQDLAGKVSVLNQRAMASITALASFKSRLLADVLACRLFTSAYPMLIGHMLQEAILYNSMLLKLQNRVESDADRDLSGLASFWNTNLAEHAKFTHGLLDPSETVLIEASARLARVFDGLAAESRAVAPDSPAARRVLDESLVEARRMKAFDASGAEGLLECKVRSIILPLIADHDLRETNHFIFLLEKGAI